jgi:hypothetical protein
VNSRRTILLIVLAGLLSRPARAEDTLPPSIIHEACGEYLKGKPFDIIARFEDESQLFDPKVMYRSSGDSHWKQVAFNKETGSEDFKATVKVKDLKGTLEYFIEVFDEFGNGPARMGSPEAPIRVEPSKVPEPCDQVPKAAKQVAVTSGSRTTPTPATGTIDTQKPPPPTTTGGTSTTTAHTTTGSNVMTQPVPPPAQSTCEQSDRPLYCEAWLWGTLGALVVVGGGVGLYFILKPSPTTTPVRESVKLKVSGPDPTAVAP